MNFVSGSKIVQNKPIKDCFVCHAKYNNKIVFNYCLNYEDRFEIVHTDLKNLCNGIQKSYNRILMKETPMIKLYCHLTKVPDKHFDFTVAFKDFYDLIDQARKISQKFKKSSFKIDKNYYEKEQLLKIVRLGLTNVIGKRYY